MKIYNQGRLVNGRFSSFKSKVRGFFRVVVRLSLIGGALYVAGVAGATFWPTTVVAENIVEVEVPAEVEYPVLDRIAKCESDGQHYGKSGQVLMSPNTNGTVDVGKYQINTVWFAKASELGLNITDPEDNQKMAEWLYANQGTEPWYATKSCWK